MTDNQIDPSDFFGDDPLDPELMPYLETRGQWPVIRHPLVYSIMHAPQMNRFVNRQLRHKTEAVTEAKKAGNWSRYVWLHERPHRWSALRYAGRHLGDADYFSLLGDVWTDTENLWQQARTTRSTVSPRGRDLTKRVHMMDDDNEGMAAFASLPDRVTVWRGHHGRNRRGWSWTADIEKARWFAGRFHEVGGQVDEATVAREHVVACMFGRGETEYVIDPRDVKYAKPTP